MSPFLVHGIEWFITAVLAGIAGYLTSSLRKKQTHDGAMEVGMQVLLRKALIDSYDYYHNQGHKMTVERRREIVEAYEAYELLGGDGVVSKMVADITDNDVWIERG